MRFPMRLILAIARGPSLLAFLVLLAMAVAITRPAGATVYSLNSDWSNVANPNGPWTLRGNNTVLPFQSNIPNLGLPGQGAWAPGSTQGNFLPSWFKAVSTNFDWVTGDVVVHTPDLANGSPFTNANVLFTAPTLGIADISGSLWNARDTSDRPQAWQLFINDVLQASGALDGVLRATPTTFNIPDVLLSAGDTIRLQIFRTNLAGTSTGDFVGSNLIVDLTATGVPVPSALLLFASGLGVFGFLGRRRTARNSASA